MKVEQLKVVLSKAAVDKDSDLITAILAELEYSPIPTVNAAVTQSEKDAVIAFGKKKLNRIKKKSKVILSFNPYAMFAFGFVTAGVVFYVLDELLGMVGY